MPRKQEKIKQLTSKDKEFLNMIKHTGICTPKQAWDACGISEKRADMLVKSKLADVDMGGRFGKVYVSNEKGNQASGGGASYHRAGGKTASHKHDLTLANQYAKIPKECRASCRPGTSIKGSSGNSHGSPDLVYTNAQGIDVGIEVWTENYTDDQIQSKIDFCSENNIELVLVEAERKF